MRRSDREQRARELGRLAYRLMVGQDVCGVLSIDDEEKHLREFNGSGISIDFYQPFRSHALAIEFSHIRLRHRGRKVFDISWNEEREFKINRFEAGEEWERELQAESEANYF